MSADLSGINFEEPFEVVMARARAKAAGLVLQSGEPISQEGRLKQNDEKLTAAIERIQKEAAKRPQPPAPPPPPSTPVMSPGERRCEWYVAPRHRNDTLESFRPITPSQKAALDATRDWIESVKRGEGGALALIGGVGTGKSHLLYAAVKELNLGGWHVAASGWHDLADLLRRAKHSGSEDYDGACMQRSRILGAKAIALDEIRPTSGSEFDTTELSQLMTRAYRECQGIMVTTNFADNALVEIIGMAAASRLTQVKVVGPDMRQPENRHLRAV